MLQSSLISILNPIQADPRKKIFYQVNPTDHSTMQKKTDKILKFYQEPKTFLIITLIIYKIFNFLKYF